MKKPIIDTYLIFKTTIRSKTLNEDFAKQVFSIIGSKNHEPGLVVFKYILTNKHDLRLYNDFELLKIYKDKYLLKQVFSIRMSTFTELNTRIKEFYNLKIEQDDT